MELRSCGVWVRIWVQSRWRRSENKDNRLTSGKLGTDLALREWQKPAFAGATPIAAVFLGDLPTKRLAPVLDALTHGERVRKPLWI